MAWLLEVEDLRKAYGAIEALCGVTFSLRAGEVSALVGDNGAGKSTLIKILSGALAPSAGKILLAGVPVHFSTTAEARTAGIETVFQHLALVEQLDVSENVFLGREILGRGLSGRLGMLNKREMRRQTVDVLQRLQIKVPPPRVPVRSLSGGQRQAVAIGRAVMWSRALLVLDEPTAALGVRETEQVLLLLEKLRNVDHLTSLVVSHNMQDVYRIADRILVLRHGKLVADLRKTETSLEEIVGYITGARRPNDPAPGK